MLALRYRRLVTFALLAAIGLASAPARAQEAEGNSRWIAVLPFGAGQFQNGDVGLGIFFAASEAVAGALSVATVVGVNALAATDTSADPAGIERNSINRSIQTLTTVNRFAFTAWATLTVAGLIDAQLSFTPRRRTRKEPPRPVITPVAAPVPGGGLIAVQGTF